MAPPQDHGDIPTAPPGRPSRVIPAQRGLTAVPTKRSRTSPLAVPTRTSETTTRSPRPGTNSGHGGAGMRFLSIGR
jgi:hypothetical protein